MIDTSKGWIHMPKFLKRLLLFSIIISVTPIVVWGIFYYFQILETTEENITERNNHILRQTHSNIERILETIDYSTTQFITSPQFNYLFELNPEVENFKIINELNNSLNKIRNRELGIERVILLNKQRDWIVTTNEGMKQYSDYPNNFYEKYKSLGENSIWIQDTQKQNSNSTQYISLVKKLPLMTNTNKPQGFIIVKVNQDKINELLMQNEKLGQIFILDGNLKPLVEVNQLSAEDNKKVSILTKDKNSFSDFNGSFESVMGNEKIEVTYRKSSYNNWIYVSTRSLNVFSEKRKAIAWFTTLVCFVIGLIMILLVFFATHKVYNPIRKVYELSKEDDDMNNTIDMNDEFLYIQNKMKSFKFEGDKLNNQIEEQLVHMRELFLLRLLLGQLKNEEIESQMGYLKNSKRFKQISVLSLQIDQVDEKEFNKNELNLILFAVNNIITELIPDNNRFSTIFDHNHHVTVLLGEYETEEEFKDYSIRLSKKIRNFIFNYLHAQVSIGIGGIYFNLSEVENSFKEAQRALNYRLKLGAGIVIHFNDVVMKSSSNSYPRNLEEALISSIRNLNRKDAKIQLEKFVTQIIENENTFSNYHFIFVQLISSITKLTDEENGVPQENIISTNNVHIEDMFQLYYKNGMVEWIYTNIVSPVIGKLEHRYSQCENITDKVLHIIHEEYETDITLESCAARINFHPNYISRVFKRDMGVSFSNYLGNYRLKMAENLLLQSQMRVSEIAEKFNYNSSAAFIRYFKKMKGMTPGEFRKLFINKNT